MQFKLLICSCRCWIGFILRNKSKLLVIGVCKLWDGWTEENAGFENYSNLFSLYNKVEQLVLVCICIPKFTKCFVLTNPLEK